MDNGSSVVAKQGPGETKTDGFRPPEEVLRCPRCDSSNTKFCYYNNYSHTQPRHFCKTCRRYWTKGGALRNVPIGGGCRKSKKSNTSKANAPFPSSKSFFHDEIGAVNNENIVQLSSDQTLAASNALKLYNGFTSSPSINFHAVEGLPKLQPSALNGFLSYDGLSSSSSSPFLPFHGSNSGHGFCGYSTGFMGSQGNFLQSSVASSIESLSAINANLHLKLQQQRLALLLAEGSTSSDHNALDATGANMDDRSRYELDLQNQQQSVGLQDPSLRNNDGISSFSSGKRTVSLVDRGDELREISERTFDQNSWPDLQQYSSLP